MRLRTLFVAIAITTSATPALAGPCLEAIAETTAKKVFEGLSKAGPADGCTLENVDTQKAEMKVIWKTKDGQLTEPVVVVPMSCSETPSGKSRLAVKVPASALGACPAAMGATRDVVESAGVGDPVKVEKPLDVPSVDGTTTPAEKLRVAFGRYGTIAIGAGAVSVAAIALVVVLRRRKRSAPPPPAG